MISLTSLMKSGIQLNESSKKIKIPFRAVKGGLDHDQVVEFQLNVRENNGTFQFLPATSKEMDKLDELDLHEDVIQILIKNHIKKTSKIILEPISGNGPGFDFRLDYGVIINKIK